MKKTSRILAVIVVLITITCLMAISASAATYDVAIGGTASLPEGPENDYGPAINEYTLSDPTLAKIVDSDTIQFLKPGTLTVTNNWKLWDGQNPIPRKGTITRTYEIKHPAPIQTTNIKLDSGSFSGGKEFPAFTVVNDENCYVEEATFYKEMVDYYVGDKLPSYSAGTTINYVSITLKPKAGYFFGWGGANDGKSHESNVYTVEYKGKKYTPYVVHDQINNELHVYVDVKYEEGQIYATTFKDLDAPYHCGPLDKTVTTNSDVELVSVKYTMFGKELTEVKKGDRVGITVRVKSKNPKNTFNANGYAYWMEQKMNSAETKLISSTEAEYTFVYNVDAIDSQIIKWADFTMPGVFAGEALPTNAFSATDGIVVKSVTWTPNDAKADASKEYTVKIEFDKKDEFIYADDFAEQGVVSINGERAKFIADVTYRGKFKTAKYYAEATFKPTVVVNTGTTGTTTVTGTVTGTYVSGTVVSGTTTPEFRIDITYNNKEVTAEKGEKVILDFTHNMDLMLCSNINYQWYKAEGPVYGTGEMVEGGHKKQLEAHTYEIGTDYYYCIMTCKFDDSEYTSDFSDSPIVKVTVTESTAKDFKVFAASEKEIVTKDGNFTLKLGVEGQGKQNVAYAWRPCNADGSFDAENYKYYVVGETDTLNYYINVNEVNVPHYFLGTASIYGGDGSVIFKVTYVPEYKEDDEEYPKEKFNLVADGKQDIGIYSWEEEVTLKAKVTETDKYADFQWHRVDKDGVVIDEKGNGGIALSMGEQLTVGPIPKDEMMMSRYYRCTAMIGNTAKSIIFTVTLYPMGVEEEYVFPFTDVKETDWFYDYVAGAHQMGLVNGKTPTEYKPNDNMTYAEAVKLAVCMNILYKGGNPAQDIQNGTDVWFSTYMNYALDKGIIDEDLTPKANEKITRKEYVYIFSKALPAEAFAAKNTIPTGSIPDIKEEKFAQDKAVYTFYRAGILSGVDSKGTFLPSDNIKRSEVAAILIRMMDPAIRVSAPAELGK